MQEHHCPLAYFPKVNVRLTESSRPIITSRKRVPAIFVDDTEHLQIVKDRIGYWIPEKGSLFQEKNTGSIFSIRTMEEILHEKEVTT